ncbi:MAG: PcfK-like family protein [Phocaeicola vulgatus]
MDFPKDQRGRGAAASRKGRINVEHGAARRPTIPKNHGTRNRLFQTDDTELSRRTGTEDELFAPRYANPKKNIDDCCTFIINQVRQSGCNGFADEEIYSMALHYYDEEDIDIGKPVSCVDTN